MTIGINSERADALLGCQDQDVEYQSRPFRRKVCLFVIYIRPGSTFKNQRSLSSKSATSSSSCTVSAGLAIHAVVHASLALKSFAPALKN